MMKAAFLLLLIVGTAIAAQPVKQFDPRQTVAAPAFASAAHTKGIDREMFAPSREPFRVGPGDKLEIEILGGDSTRRTALIGPDGKLYYALSPSIDVSFLTLDEIRQELAKQLAGYYREPQISVTMAEVRSKRVSVLGRVNKPGIYPLTRPTTIVDAISQAGGLFTSRFSGSTEELADLDHSFIIRGRKMIPVNFARLLRGGDMSQNIYLEPNDLIYLPSALSKQINVIGAVRQPRAVGFSQEMNLAAAISAALGPIPGADLRRVAIVRGSLAKPEVAVVDFIAIQEGKAPNVRIQPRDIIYVPNSRWLSLSHLVDLVTNTFARTVAANEGARAASPSAEPVRPTLSVGP